MIGINEKHVVIHIVNHTYTYYDCFINLRVILVFFYTLFETT